MIQTFPEETHHKSSENVMKRYRAREQLLVQKNDEYHEGKILDSQRDLNSGGNKNQRSVIEKP